MENPTDNGEKARRASDLIELLNVRWLRPLIELGDVAKRLGGLEQAIAESKRRLHAAQTEEAAVVSDRDNKKQEALQIIDDATERATK